MVNGLLHNAHTTHSLIAVRTNEQACSERIVGFVERYDERVLTLAEIDPFGACTGNVTIRRDCIVTIEIGTTYQQQLMTLIDEQELFDACRQVTMRQHGTENERTIHELMRRNCLATCFFEGRQVTGVILKYEHGLLLIEEVSAEGRQNGVSVHPVDALTGIRYDGPHEQKIAVLSGRKRKPEMQVAYRKSVI